MAKKVLFWPDVYLEQGHWLPTVVWAQGLTNRGYTVEYMGIEDCASVVQPFDFVANPGANQKKYHMIFPKIYPLGYTREKQSSISERWKTDHVFAIADGALNSIFTGPNKPDLLVSGYFTSLESLMLHYLYNVEVVITTTYLRHPQDDPAIRAIQNLMAFPRAVARKLMKAVMGDRWNDDYEIEDFVKPLETFDELIPCPQEFEFSHYQHGDKVHFTEPCMTPETKNSSEFWQKIPSNKKYLFATSGSQVQDYEVKAEQLFRQLIDMMSLPQMNGYHLILGVGPKLSKEDWGTSTHYTVCDWVPQREILDNSNTKVAFIHGGLATIKECIFKDKPFVILPMGKDQMDNALRLRQKGLALLAYPERSDADTLAHNMNQILSDSWTSERRHKMSLAFQALEYANPPPGLAVLLEKLA